MFFGNYQVALDEKGRVHIPAVLSRQVEGDEMMVAEWGPCLAAFPKSSFEKMAEELYELSKKPENREKVHRIVSHFFPGTLKSGKLLIPQELRNGFKLDKKIQVVGMLRHIELWNQSDWNNRDVPRDKSNIRDDLNDLGLL